MHDHPKIIKQNHKVQAHRILKSMLVTAVIMFAVYSIIAVITAVFPSTQNPYDVTTHIIK